MRERKRNATLGVLFAASVVTAAFAPAILAAPPDALRVKRGELVDLPQLATPLKIGARLAIPRVTLPGAGDVALELERFDVLAPGAQVVVTGEHGISIETPAVDRYYRGTVAGDPDSWVFLAAGRGLRGLVTTRGRTWAVAPEQDLYRGRPVIHTASRVFELDQITDSPESTLAWRCGTDELPPLLGERLTGTERASSAGPESIGNGITYAADVAIDTDYELYLHFGSTAGLTTYVTDLVAASSAIYNRDLQANLRLATFYIYTTSADPWTATGTLNALYELGDYWHANRASVPRTIVHFLSAKGMGGGIAWLSVLCRSDFSYGGHWGGGYGVSASLNGAFSTTNPSLYWDILCFSHEVGHNFGSPHTQCYTPTPVDTCCNCSTGVCSGTVPPGGGTIMSYCHLLPGGYNNIILYFGKPGEPSQAVLDLMRAYIESQGAAGCLPPVDTLDVTSVDPTFGPVAGGTTVTITGSGFQSGATVSFGGTAASSVVFSNSTTLQAVTPAHAAGAVDVTVTIPRPQSATAVSAFTYSSVAGQTRFYTLTPCRIFDTREASGPAAAAPALAGSARRDFQVTSRCGVPTSAIAVSVNVTTVNAQVLGSLTIVPADIAAALSNTISYKPGRARANNAILELAGDGTGRIGVINLGTATVDFILDVNGYFQ